MDVYIYVDGQREPILYLDAAFSVGLSILVDEAIPTGATVKLTKYFPTGDLWVFRMKTNTEGTPVRHNIELFPSGTWKRARVREEEPVKARKARVH